MEALFALWLPILAASGLVFLASSVIHMMLPIHRGDFDQLPNEANTLEDMRKNQIAPGAYMFPFGACAKDMNTDEMKAKYHIGPVGFMTVLPSGPMQMGKSLGQWFLFNLAMSILVAYVASLVFAAGADYRTIFRFTATVAFLGYSFNYVQDSIWKGQRWTVSLKFMFDGLVYSLVTAGTFGWLWPEA